jgi:hypothetical protein
MLVHKINMIGAILGARVSQLVPKGHSCLVGHTMGLASGPERGIKVAREKPTDSQDGARTRDNP